MLLNRLKSCRIAKGYSVRDLAARSGIDASNISLLENLKRSPHGKTVRTLAEALEVDVTDLYEAEQPAQLIPPVVNTNETPTVIRPARSGVKKQPLGNCWVIDHEGDAFGPFVPAEAERLKGKLVQARVYEAESKNDARELHRAFLVRVARGHDAW